MRRAMQTLSAVDKHATKTPALQLHRHHSKAGARTKRHEDSGAHGERGLVRLVAVVHCLLQLVGVIVSSPRLLHRVLAGAQGWRHNRTRSKRLTGALLAANVGEAREGRCLP